MAEILKEPLEKIIKINFPLKRELAKIGIETVGDLLYYFPFRYEDFSRVKKISELRVGEKACIFAKVLTLRNFYTKKKRMVLTEGILQDSSGSIFSIWFNQPFIINFLKKGEWYYFVGKVERKSSKTFFSCPIFEKGKNGTLHTKGIVPVYSETSKLSSRHLRRLIKRVLKRVEKKLEDFLPLKVAKCFLPLRESFWQVHFPSSLQEAEKARERFKFQELFLLELSVLREKFLLSEKRAPKIPIKLEEIKKFVQELPFLLLSSQKKALWQILKDINKEKPMNRLLEGDVGSGKTICALIAAFNTALSGYQVAFLAPTEILARQHYLTFLEFLKNWKIKISLLTRNFKFIDDRIATEKEILFRVSTGEIKILIGTHTLFQEKVKFSNLGFVILDEQQRFGVFQREKLLKEREVVPHFLSLTATPIPRTLALTLYGDLDLTIIDEMPTERKVTTKVVLPEDREKVYEFLRKKILEKNQVFIVCPAIEPSEKEKRAVKLEFEKISKIFPEFKVAFLHGKMRGKEKEWIMERFRKGEIDILIATSVVEVGLDIERANIMIIEGAEKFGLFQLHQFRGRIGRRGKEAYLFLFFEGKGKKAAKRILAILETENGFEVAKRDLEIRGPGEFFGKRQWGLPDFTMEALRDVKMVERARNLAKEILISDPSLKKHPTLKKLLEDFSKKITLY